MLACRINLFILLLAFAGVAGAAAVPQIDTDGSWRWANIPRVVAFGDVHGAYEELVGLLQGTGLIDERLDWAGGTSHLVSLGDLLDRGPDSRRVLDLLMQLQRQAADAGGAVHVVLGNHELMNLSGDLRYLVAEDYAEFAAQETAQMRDAAFAAYQRVAGAAVTRARFDAQFPSGYFARGKAFTASGVYGAWLMKQPMSIVINDTAFVHGGLAPLVAEGNLQSLNEQFHRDLSQWLESYARLGQAGYDSSRIDALAGAADPAVAVDGDSAAETADVALAQRYLRLGAAPIFSERGPLWYRGTALCHLYLEHELIERGLAALSARRVVIGHTPTGTRRVMQRDGGRVIMLDTGMLQSYYHGHPALLVLEGAAAAVVYADAPTSSVPVDDADERLQPRGWSQPQVEQILAQGQIVESHPRADGQGGELALELRGGEQLLPATFTPLSGKQAAAEVAAYRIDALLGLNLVAVTVARTVEGKTGVVASAPKRSLSEETRRSQALARPNWCGAGNDYQLMYVFDALIGNARRTASEIVYDRSSWRLQLVHNARAFNTSRKLAASEAAMLQPLSKSFATALAALTSDSLHAAVGDLLNQRQIDALLARRDGILTTWQRGE
jgi:hypothetical protein